MAVISRTRIGSCLMQEPNRAPARQVRLLAEDPSHELLAVLESSSELSQLLPRCPLPCIGPVCRQIRVSDRLTELTCREVISQPSDPVVEVIAGLQRRLQQLATEEFVNQQRRDVALPGRGIVRRPLAGGRQRPCRAQRALNRVWIEAHRHVLSRGVAQAKAPELTLRGLHSHDAALSPARAAP